MAYSSTGTSSSTANNVWSYWTEGTSTNCTSTTTTWNIWCSSGNIYNVNSQIRELTEEERETQRVAAEESRKRAEEARLAKEEAKKRSMVLLRENLSQKQREALDKHGWFLVEGGKTGKTYKIKNTGYQGNIIEMNGDKEVASLCIHADYTIPLGDQLLAQALHIHLDEEFLIKTANRTPRLAA